MNSKRTKIKLKTLNKISKIVAVLCVLLLLPIFVTNDIHIFGIELEKICEYILFFVLISVLLFVIFTKTKLIIIFHNGKSIQVEEIPYVSRHQMSAKAQQDDGGEKNDTIKPFPQAVPKVIGIGLIVSSAVIIGCMLLFFILGDKKDDSNYLLPLIAFVFSLLMASIGFFILRYFQKFPTKED